MKGKSKRRIWHRNGGPRHPGAFHAFAHTCARAAGHLLSFGVAVALLIAWAVSGPLFGFSDTWQLVINPATTMVTFLMVFLIQNTQNRDSEAMQLKLDELIRATAKAHNALLDLEKLSEQELDQVQSRYQQLAEKARADLRAGKSDLGTPEVGKKGGGLAWSPEWISPNKSGQRIRPKCEIRAES